MDSLPSLTPGVYVRGECIDFYLRTHWMKERNRACMWFLHLEAVKTFSTEEGPEQAELVHLREQLCLPAAEDIDLRPVVFVVVFVDHYFVVVIDYEEDVMYVFGRHINPALAGVYPHNEEDWMGWKGHLLWSHVRKLFRWDGHSMVPNVVVSTNWPQVSACKPHIVFLCG